MASGAAYLANTVGFDLIGSKLGEAVESAVRSALDDGAVFLEGTDPLTIFRKTLMSSIVDIEKHPRGVLFQRFLQKGPYEGSGAIPSKLADQRLSDAETAKVISYIYSHMVNCFQGAVTELLASHACMKLIQRLQEANQVPSNARLYVGDSVGIHRPSGNGILKGADQHILLVDEEPGGRVNVTVLGVTEVKSYVCSQKRLQDQIERHVQRVKLGLSVEGVGCVKQHIKVGFGPHNRICRISVVPSAWKLPRAFWFEPIKNGRHLHSEPAEPKIDDEIKFVRNDEWRIVLKWSKEALASAAYEMTFWYMSKVGEVIYSRSVPKAWGQMTPAEAGRNAVKMMLYYSLIRCNSDREQQRAIALYNSYCFGYALGMNFKNAQGKRKMLWPEDLDEILVAGKTKHGCKLY